MDQVVRCETLPAAGETIIAHGTEQICGGKGANQAVAASRAGGETSMVGRVGDDAVGGRMVDNLNRHGVQTDHIARTANTTSGLAIVAVDDGGQNSIMVVSGANACVTAEDVVAASDRIAAADVVLMQFEIPVATVQAAITICRRVGTTVVLDPAPVPADIPDAIFKVDMMCPNQHEATRITGIDIVSVDDATAAANELHRRGPRNVAITMGERGTLLSTGDRIDHVPAPPVTAVDTTAAGDAFAGALAVRWAETDDWSEAVRFASAAGAIAATRPGAQTSLPNRREIQSVFEQHLTG